ncbi:MAG TPA: indole-3-glycerol phosphate synthase TrpC [Gemmatimonadota bacterium]|nr:indole-3-glycerol phosphate synthase TrpC [Gemmatimonadota bacterium]
MDEPNLSEQNPKVKPGYLDEVLARKRDELAAARWTLPLPEIKARAAGVPAARPWAEALKGSGVAVIAEVKRRSPSSGTLHPEPDPVARARTYVENGAAAVSVLTDRDFDGRLEDLERVSQGIDLPVLRKDFLIDPWQIWESRAAGADAALLVVPALPDVSLNAIALVAHEARLSLLVEIHAPEDIPRALALEPSVVGVNARDLQTLVLDWERARRTMEAFQSVAGDDVVLVAESGIASAADVRRARDAGADAVLVGEALMRAADPGALLAELVAAGDSP